VRRHAHAQLARRLRARASVRRRRAGGADGDADAGRRPQQRRVRGGDARAGGVEDVERVRGGPCGAACVRVRMCREPMCTACAPRGVCVCVRARIGCVPVCQCSSRRRRVCVRMGSRDSEKWDAQCVCRACGDSASTYLDHRPCRAASARCRRRGRCRRTSALSRAACA
jgi:hypothetical protein